MSSDANAAQNCWITAASACRGRHNALHAEATPFQQARAFLPRAGSQRAVWPSARPGNVAESPTRCTGVLNGDLRLREIINRSMRPVSNT